MDTALKLRLAHEKEEPLDTVLIDQWLNDSQLVKKLTEQPVSTNGLTNLFHLIGLAEIPYIERLDHTQKLIDYVENTLATSEGFSYTGEVDQIVPCYNALLLEAYARLGLSHYPSAQRALHWIKNYQLFERNQQTTWAGKGIKKHGGCLNAVPCYIGIGKTIRALITWQEYQKTADPEVDQLIKQGLAYMLQHRFFLRLTSDTPISKHITSSAFPQSYFLSLTDLVYIAGKGQVLHEENTQPLLELLKTKQVKSNEWKLEHIYSYKGYTSFETRRKPSKWLSTLYPLWLG
ncbi:hypothetical protein [Candidatus Enterococcus clewellii]|uniref:Uncharacterized protein n=1 Tax=Candidatus Enterococcus clewellii TaxID=1834193 RepID=A0A242K813_9ENTE|nr:hypothetical protein [Enterococcus sp. 9E7_DIV0242]OTP17315.1 hypothetical protein A5888_001453 [Enterococcus sp. 9E7_DIV0242]